MNNAQRSENERREANTIPRAEQQQISRYLHLKQQAREEQQQRLRACETAHMGEQLNASDITSGGEHHAGLAENPPSDKTTSREKAFSKKVPTSRTGSLDAMIRHKTSSVLHNTLNNKQA
jgi:hypothetical protein